MEQKYFEVAVNQSYGVFCLSKQAVRLYEKKTGKKLNSRLSRERRSDPYLIDVIKELGSERASGKGSDIIIEKVPSEFRYTYKISEIGRASCRERV